MKQFKVEGILPALVTPFLDDNKTINTESAKMLIERFLDQGANGFYILGGTGEGLVMAREEREIMCDLCVKQVAGRKPVINHIAAMNMNEACELAKHAEKAGCDAIAAVPPSFFSYDEDDIYEYYKRLAGCVNIPVIIYYHPAAQKDMSAKLISHIFEIDNVTGVKWSSGNYYELMKLKDMTKGEMNIINGPDEMLLCGLSAGADAGIGSTYNIMLPQFVKVYDCFKAGKLDEALATQLQINRVIDVLLKNSLIPSIKHALKLSGIDCGTGTFPMKQLSNQQIAKLEKELSEAGWPIK